MLSAQFSVSGPLTGRTVGSGVGEGCLEEEGKLELGHEGWAGFGEWETRARSFWSRGTTYALEGWSEGTVVVWGHGEVGLPGTQDPRPSMRVKVLAEAKEHGSVGFQSPLSEQSRSWPALSRDGPSSKGEASIHCPQSQWRGLGVRDQALELWNKGPVGTSRLGVNPSHLEEVPPLLLGPGVPHLQRGG